MIILGWHGGLNSEWEQCGYGHAMHDSSAAILVNGEIVAAIEEERLNRVKHSNVFPFRAIQYCLEEAKIEIEDVDLFAFGFDEEKSNKLASRNFMNDPGTKDWYKSVEDLRSTRTAHTLFSSLFEKHFGTTICEKLRFVPHHFAHASGAYHLCGFDDDTLVACFDGDGDGLSGLIARSVDGRLITVKEFDQSQSLGAFYRNAISLLGYKIFDEYKVMGLAPYGNPEIFKELFSDLYQLLPAGEFAIESAGKAMDRFLEHGLLTHVRASGEEFTQVHKDLAAAIQHTLETIMFHVVSHFGKTTGCRSICLTGGVAHNCSFNGNLYYSGLFKNIFALPFAHDAGNAVGAALAVYHEESTNNASQKKLSNVYLGSGIGNNDEIAQELKHWDNFVKVERSDDAPGDVANLIADDKVVAWVQGRAEFGPRALGNRSILADPRPSINKERINRMIKKREGYRPFAPTIKEEEFSKYFECVPETNADFRFMNFVLKVNRKYHEELGAITHVDGTGRIQTVSNADNPKYWKLIDAFQRKTGIPIVLNTSLNNHAEPIVNSVEDALTCFLTTDLNHLVVGDYLLSRQKFVNWGSALNRFSVSLRPSQKLCSGAKHDETGAQCSIFFIESNSNFYFTKPRTEISRTLFQVLSSGVINQASIAETLRATELVGVNKERFVSELMRLWRDRIIRFAPIYTGQHLSAESEFESQVPAKKVLFGT